jgi:hypothetical protein
LLLLPHNCSICNSIRLGTYASRLTQDLSLERLKHLMIHNCQNAPQFLKQLSGLQSKVQLASFVYHDTRPHRQSFDRKRFDDAMSKFLRSFVGLKQLCIEMVFEYDWQEAP